MNGWKFDFIVGGKYISRGFAHGYLTLEDDMLTQRCVDNDFCGAMVKYENSDIIWDGKAWLSGQYILYLKKIKNAMWLRKVQ